MTVEQKKKILGTFELAATRKRAIDFSDTRYGTSPRGVLNMV